MELVIDANILISGLIKKGITRELMFNIDLLLYTSEFIIDEYLKHIKEIAKKSKKSTNQIQDLAEILIVESNLIIVTKEEVKPFIHQAENISPDPKDVQYFATALKLNCPIWSNDKALQKQDRVKILSTADIIRLISLK